MSCYTQIHKIRITHISPKFSVQVVIDLSGDIKYFQKGLKQDAPNHGYATLGASNTSKYIQ